MGQNDLLEARLADAVRLAESGRRARFIGFLDEHEAKHAVKYLERMRSGNYLLWGGHPDAERVIFGAFPDFLTAETNSFPVAALTVSFHSQDRLTHRDFLGAFLHAGVERSVLGDILTEDGRAVIFCKQEISSFLCSQIEKIGGTGVRISDGACEPFPPAHHFAEFSSVVASARLDCLVAAAVGTSREKASELIRSQLVERNHEAVLSVSEDVREGDILSVRGVGRFVIDRLGPVTKKGRLSIAGRKYI